MIAWPHAACGARQARTSAIRTHGDTYIYTANGYAVIGWPALGRTAAGPFAIICFVPYSSKPAPKFASLMVLIHEQGWFKVGLLLAARLVAV